MYLDVSRSEQELPIQVWFLNGVHICDKQVSWSTARQSYHSKVFKMFTSYSTSSNLQGERNARKNLKRQRCILITAKFTFRKMTVKFHCNNPLLLLKIITQWIKLHKDKSFTRYVLIFSIKFWWLSEDLNWFFQDFKFHFKPFQDL